MKRLGVVLIATTLFATPLTAVAADPTPAPTLSAQEQYKLDFAAFQEAMRAREAQVSAIFQTFNASVRKAKSDYAAAITQAKGADAKYQAKLALKNSIQSAADSYDAALAALGPAPVPPQKPMKVARQPITPPNKKNKN